MDAAEDRLAGDLEDEAGSRSGIKMAINNARMTRKAPNANGGPGMMF